MSSPAKKVKFQTVPSGVTEGSGSMTTSEICELRRLLEKFRATAPPAEVTAFFREYNFEPIDNNKGSQNGTEEEEDWTQNHVILTEIFRHLPVPDLKIVRFVCKFWAQIAAPVLTAESVLRITQLGLKKERTAAQDLLAFLDLDGNRCWDSGFKSEMQTVELDLTRDGNRANECFIWSRSALEAFQKFITSDQFCFVTILKLKHIDIDDISTLLLPYWLPTYGKKLKTLQLIHVRSLMQNRNLLPTPETLPPEGVQLELENLTIDYDVNIVPTMVPWGFLRNCLKLKHLSMPEVPKLTQIADLTAYLDSILQDLGETQLESLALQFRELLSLEVVDACKSFTKRLVAANGRNLKCFSVELQTDVEAQLSVESLTPTWELAPSVKMARFHLQLRLPEESDSLNIRWRQILAQLVSRIHQQWFRDGRRLEIQFAAPIDFYVNLIIKSPKELVLQFASMEALENEDNVFLQNVLPRLFPEINYVCFARQSPTDGGFSYETTLLERFGRDGVFNLVGVLWDMTSAVGPGEDSRYKMRFLHVNQRTRTCILNPVTIREAAAVGLEGWTDDELMRKHHKVFVYGHVPQNQMEAAWGKIQNHVCTFKSVEEGFTPEVVWSGQGSFTVCRKFTTWLTTPKQL